MSIMEKISWEVDYDKLATYNSEVHRGLVHTTKYKLKMEEIQKEYNTLINQRKYKNRIGEA